MKTKRWEFTRAQFSKISDRLLGAAASEISGGTFPPEFTIAGMFGTFRFAHVGRAGNHIYDVSNSDMGAILYQ